MNQIQYILMCSILTFLVFGLDKYFAMYQKRRIPENILIAMAAIGGSIGALLAMFIFRHKTHKYFFTIGVPMIMICQLIFFILVNAII